MRCACKEGGAWHAAATDCSTDGWKPLFPFWDFGEKDKCGPQLRVEETKQCTQVSQRATGKVGFEFSKLSEISTLTGECTIDARPNNLVTAINIQPHTAAVHMSHSQFRLDRNISSKIYFLKHSVAGTANTTHHHRSILFGNAGWLKTVCGSRILDKLPARQCRPQPWRTCFNVDYDYKHHLSLISLHFNWHNCTQTHMITSAYSIPPYHRRANRPNINDNESNYSGYHTTFPHFIHDFAHIYFRLRNISMLFARPVCSASPHSLLVSPQFSCYFAAPAIRVVDEQGYEIRDRYYKIGSTIDLSCQVALSYLNKNATSIAETSMPMPYKSSTASIKENLIDVPAKPKSSHHTNDNFYKRIVWKKDGENVSKDALFNLR